MATYVFPKLFDQAAKKITNDERARAPRGGLLKFSSDAFETATGERSIGSLAESTFTPGLGLAKLAQLGLNHDFFTWRKIAGTDEEGWEGAKIAAKQRLAWLWKGTLPGQQAARMDQSGFRQTMEGLLGFKFPIEHGIRMATEIRRDEGGSNPPDPEKAKVFQSIMAAAEQSHRSFGQDTSLRDALLESDKLSPAEKTTLREAMNEEPIVFAVRGLEHPQDFYKVFQHSTEMEKAALIQDAETRHKLVQWEEEMRSAGRTEDADRLATAIEK
jgi:hypothetical protein